MLRQANQFTVSVASDALLEMLLLGVESMLASRDSDENSDGLEVAGAIWGSVQFDKQRTFVNVAKVSAYTKYLTREPGEVLESTESLELKKKVIGALWPHYRYLGYFHTHPYADTTMTEVRGQNLDTFSKDDWTVFGSRKGDSVWLVLTIAEKKKKVSHFMGLIHRKNSNAIDFSCIEFVIGNLSFWVRAYVRTKNSTTEKKYNNNVILHCPTITGIGTEQILRPISFRL